MKSEKEWVAELAEECHTFPNEIFRDDVNALIRRIQADALREAGNNFEGKVWSTTDCGCFAQASEWCEERAKEIESQK